MNLVFNLFSVLIVALGALIVIVSNTEPTNNLSIINIGFFLFVLLFTYSLSYLLYLLIAKRATSEKRLLNRRIVLFSVSIGGFIAMSSLQVLNIISAISFLLSLVLLELFFMSQNRDE